jgi:hypothetical protein
MWKMKINVRTLLFLGFICLCGGFLCEKSLDKIKITQNMSRAGGTLQGISRALEDEKSKSGKYPEDLKLLDGSSFVTGDYSKEMATRVIYIRTEQGYFMMVGSPFHAFTDQTGHIQFK